MDRITMPELAGFPLEDFLYEYEHRSDLINLATSDLLGWSLEEIRSIHPDWNELGALRLEYPNVRDSAIHAICAFHNAPGWIDALLTTGAAEAIFLALQERRVQGADRIRIAVPRPGFGAFEGISRLLGFEIKFYNYSRGRDWQVDAHELVELASECEVVIINSPHNPSGRVLAEQVIQELVTVAERRDMVLVLDEVFRLPEEVRRSAWTTENIVIVGSLSKAYGVPGLRFGWAMSGKRRIQKMRTLQQYLTLSPNSLGVALGPLVLNHADQFSRREHVIRNRQIVLDWAAHHPSEVKLSRPEGGNTTILQMLVSADEDQLFEALLKRRVLLVPGGRCFGVRDCTWFRLGYGIDATQLQEGLAKITDTLEALGTGVS
jgi:aspartate/methionine/tyrosine aminotransferase